MDGPALRLYSGDDSQPAAPALTLRQAFDRYMRDEISRTRAAATLAQYETALRHWERFVATQGESLANAVNRLLSVNPAMSTMNTHIQDSIHAITDMELARFRDWLEDDGMSTASIRKTWRFLRPLFNRLGPRVPGNPRGVGLISHVPYLNTESGSVAPQQASIGERTIAGSKRILTIEELDSLYSACTHATWPGGKCPPAACLWRSMLVMWYAYGLRTQDCAQLSWSAVITDRHSPDPDSTATWEHGWLTYVPAKTARRKSAALVLPLSDVARRHLESIRSERELIFALPNSPNDFYGQWKALLTSAGVRKCQIKDLRKTCNTAYNRIPGLRGIGSWILGHAPRGVNATFYTGVEAELLAAIPQLPYPPAMVAGATERQKWLW